MSDSVRLLLTAAILSLVTLVVFAVRLTRLDPSQAERRIGELRLAQWAAILFAAAASIPIGIGAARADVPTAHLDVAIGVALVVVAGGILLREPREALLVVAAAFIAHALIDAAHRPGWLSPDLVSRNFTIGSATYDLCVAAICYWARRR